MLRTIKASESSSSSEWIRLCRSKDWPSLLIRAAQLKQQQQHQQQSPRALQSNGHGKDNSHDKVATCKASRNSAQASSNSIFSSESINDSPSITSSLFLSNPLGTSILSLAVRAGAPLFVLETLVQLDPQQLYQVTATTTTLSSSSSTTTVYERSLPRGITILHDAVRYCCIRSASMLQHDSTNSSSRSSNSGVDKRYHDDHCGWKVLEFLVERIFQQQQQQQLEGNEQQKQESKLQKQQESSSWRVCKRDRYTMLPVTYLPSIHVAASTNLFAIQDNAGRTALHYLVEQQLRQLLLLLLSTSSVNTNPSHEIEDDQDAAAAADTDEVNGEQFSRSSSSLSSSISCILEASWRAFEKMISANPAVMQIMDSDGNTALVLLLAASTQHVAADAIPHDNNGDSSSTMRQRHNIMEAEILRRVQLMLKLCPAQVAVSRKVPSSRKAVSWRIPQWQQQQQRLWQQSLVTTENNITPSDASSSVLIGPCSASTTSTSAAANPTAFPVHGLPLYYALLYGRRPETILELVRAQRCMGYNGCSVVVTQYAEYLLHIAVTRRAPLAVLELLVNEYQAATLAPDVYGLTPLEWLWMTHVMDWHQATSMHHQHQQHNNDNGPDEWAFSLLSPSRRRFLHRDYMEWYNEILNHHCTPYTADRYDVMDTKTGRSMQNELLKRIKILFPRAAATEIGVAPLLVGSFLDNNNSLVHAACRLCGGIPRGMLQMVLAMDPEANVQLRSPDSAGRYPLHYAAAAAPFTGYRASLPLGITRGVSLLQEESPVALVLSHFPAASRATDINGQLPLHIVIDAAKNQEQDFHAEQHLSASTCTAAAAAATPPSPAIRHEGKSTVLDILLSHWPESIRQRDGKTRLFPWQQAAVGQGASLQTIYTLLRRDPTCVVTRH